MARDTSPDAGVVLLAAVATRTMSFHCLLHDGGGQRLPQRLQAREQPVPISISSTCDAVRHLSSPPARGRPVTSHAPQNASDLVFTLLSRHARRPAT